MSQTSISSEGMARSASRRNRRATIRYRCAPATVGKVFSSDDHEFQRAWIIDLSLHGVGMQLSRPLELGRLVYLSIRSSDGLKVHELAAHVIRANPVPHGDWYVGCELVKPLTPDELDELL